MNARKSVLFQAFLWFLLAVGAGAYDWPNWRGAVGNGVAYESDLPDSTSMILWRIPYGGRSTPVIHDGRVYVIDAAGSAKDEMRERVMSVDLKTGDVIWEYLYPVFHTDIVASRAGWASCAVDPETGNVYSNGVGGLFQCFSRDGKRLWTYSITELFGGFYGFGGRVQTPIVDEDRVIMSHNTSSFGDQAVGRQRHVAVDKRTGEILWWAAPGGPPEDAIYSTPVIGVVNGMRLFFGGNADGGVYAMKSRTGEKVWGFPLSLRGVNVSPVFDNGKLYVAHSEENTDGSTAMGRVDCLNAATGEEIWKRDGLTVGYVSPAIYNGRLYVCDNAANMFCLNADTGETIWELSYGRVGKGSPVVAGDTIYILEVNSKFVIIKDRGDHGEVVDEMTFEKTGPEIVSNFGSPAVSDGKVVFFTSEELVCLGRRGDTAASHDLPQPELPATPPAGEPATLLVRPAEILVHPGDARQFTALLFDAKGNPVGRPENVEWSFNGPIGTLDAKGAFKAGERGGIGEAVAVAGGLTGKARIRLVPNLPIQEDFESYPADGMVSWWIGASKARHAIVEMDGGKVLKKISDNRGPVFNRSRVFITDSVAPGAFVQADMMAERKGARRKGDMGLINDRYQIELVGNSNQLKITAWAPLPRIEKILPFSWEPETWITMKTHVAVENGQAAIQAKVWKRGDPEPEAWTLEVVDATPHLEGALGLYANTMDSIGGAVFFDNVRMWTEPPSSTAAKE